MRRLIILVSVLACAAPAMAAITFDKPLATETVVVPPVQGSRAQTVTCRQYPGFMLVSAFWEGNTTDGQYFVLPYRNKVPRCVPEIAQAQTDIYGKVAGVKGRYIVVDPGTAGHDYFSIYDGVTRKQLLSESATASPEAMTLMPDGFALRYRRIFQAGCSLFYGADTACWSEIKAATGLTDPMLPDCRAAYAATQKKWQVRADAMPQRTSSIIYSAEVRYAGGKTTYAALPGKVICASGYI